MYFYNPIGYACNTDKFIKFASDENANFDSKRQTSEEPGWSKVRQFFNEPDESVYKFTIDQLKRRVKQPVVQFKEKKKLNS